MRVNIIASGWESVNLSQLPITRQNALTLFEKGELDL